MCRMCFAKCLCACRGCSVIWSCMRAKRGPRASILCGILLGVVYVYVVSLCVCCRSMPMLSVYAYVVIYAYVVSLTLSVLQTFSNIQHKITPSLPLFLSSSLPPFLLSSPPVSLSSSLPFSLSPSLPPSLPLLPFTHTNISADAVDTASLWIRGRNGRISEHQHISLLPRHPRSVLDPRVLQQSAIAAICVRVRERERSERERERRREGGRQRGRQRQKERMRKERERESVCVCVSDILLLRYCYLFTADTNIFYYY